MVWDVEDAVPYIGFMLHLRVWARADDIRPYNGLHVALMYGADAHCASLQDHCLSTAVSIWLSIAFFMRLSARFFCSVTVVAHLALIMKR